MVDRLILSEHAVLETTFAARTFEVDQNTQGDLTMVYAPQTQSGNFFNRQERDVRSYQLVEALSISKDGWAGQHVFKFGLDLQRSSFDGDDLSHGVDVVRLDGSLAERTTYRASEIESWGQRHRVRAVCAGSVARQRSAELRARPPPGS